MLGCLRRGRRSRKRKISLVIVASPKEDVPGAMSNSPSNRFSKSRPPVPTLESQASEGPTPSSLATLVHSELRRRVKSSVNMDKIARWNRETLAAKKHLRAAVLTSSLLHLAPSQARA
jgi:hypothetical protein